MESVTLPRKLVRAIRHTIIIQNPIICGRAAKESSSADFPGQEELEEFDGQHHIIMALSHPQLKTTDGSM